MPRLSLWSPGHSLQGERLQVFVGYKDWPQLVSVCSNLGFMVDNSVPVHYPCQSLQSHGALASWAVVGTLWNQKQTESVGYSGASAQVMPNAC